MALQRRLKARRFAFRIQQFSASSTKPRRVKLIAMRKIVSKGRAITAGVDVAQNGLNAVVAKPKAATIGRKVRDGS